MPTGYTADLYDGKDKTFQEFALGCARAFGATITMRDEPADAVIPDEFEPDEWQKESLEKAITALDEASRLSLDEWAAEERADRERTRKEIEESARSRAAIRARYEGMLVHVRGWQPPSSEHERFKEFMVSQLEDSIKHDCGDTSRMWTVPSPRSPQSFRDARLQLLRQRVERAEESWRAEQERTEKRNWWVRELRESLAGA